MSNKYCLKPNTICNYMSVSSGEYSPDIMKVSLNDFLEQADNFINDRIDSMFCKGADYNFYGEAIEIQRCYVDENPEKDLVCLFVHAGFNSSGIQIMSFNEFGKFVRDTKNEVFWTPNSFKKKGWRYW